MRETADTIGMAQRRSTEEIDQLVEQYRASGLTQIEYCRQTGMVLSSLGRYLRRHGGAEQRLIEVNVESACVPTAEFAVVLVNGRRIQSGWGFADTELARLIRVAESA
ncbi:MAG: IS66 family insertion sequence element accessory protein TnpA [Candidatus Angelobacter sp.]